MNISPIDYASKLQYSTQLQPQTNKTCGEAIKPVENTDCWVGKSVLDGGTIYSGDTPMSIEAGPDAPVRDPDAKIRVYYNALLDKTDAADFFAYHSGDYAAQDFYSGTWGW